MKLKIKIGIIGLGVIVLLVGVVGIYWLASNKKIPTPLKFTSKEAILTLKQDKEKLPKKLEPKLVWQKEFDSEIEDMRICTMPKNGIELPIITVRTEKNLFLFNKNGEIIRTFPSYVNGWYSLIISKDGRYVMEITPTENEWLGDYKYTTLEGNILWEKKNIAEDESYGILNCITPQGDRVIMIGNDDSYPNRHSGIWFYNEKGSLVKGYSYKDIRYSKDGIIEYMNTKYAISGDGNFFIFAYRDLDDWKKYHLIAFDKDGRILWKRSIQMQKYSPVGAINVSYYGKIICIDEIDEYIYIYNKKGNLIHKLEKMYDKEYLQKFFISPKGDFLVAVFPSFIALIDIITGKEIKKIKLKTDLNFALLYDIVISPNNQLIAIKSTKDRLYIITHQGDVILKKDIAGEECIFSKDSNFIFIRFLMNDYKTIRLYKMEVGNLK